MKKHPKRKSFQLAPAVKAALEKQRDFAVAAVGEKHPKMSKRLAAMKPAARRRWLDMCASLKPKPHVTPAKFTLTSVPFYPQGLTPDDFANLARCEPVIVLNLSSRARSLLDSLVNSGLHGRTPADCCERMVCAELQKLSPHRPK